MDKLNLTYSLTKDKPVSWFPQIKGSIKLDGKRVADIYGPTIESSRNPDSVGERTTWGMILDHNKFGHSDAWTELSKQNSGKQYETLEELLSNARGVIEKLVEADCAFMANVYAAIAEAKAQGKKAVVKNKEVYGVLDLVSCKVLHNFKSVRMELALEDWVLLNQHCEGFTTMDVDFLVELITGKQAFSRMNWMAYQSAPNVLYWGTTSRLTTYVE